MKSILDTGNSWFLERLLYGDSLIIFIVEGIRSPIASPIIIGEVNLGEGYSVDITDESRHFVVKFEDVIAYQIQNESFTYGDEYERRTEGALCKYERSRYLDYVKSHSLIDSLRENQYAHYGLMLEDEIIDVISETEPKVMDVSSEEMQNELKLRFADEDRI